MEAGITVSFGLFPLTAVRQRSVSFLVSFEPLRF
jgi:hypothetical protein